MKRKAKARAASILLSLMMVVTFIPLFGTQEAWAIPIKDPITIDLTNGEWESWDVNQRNAIRQLLFDLYNDGNGVISLWYSSHDHSETLYLDLDNDGYDDVSVENDTYDLDMMSIHWLGTSTSSTAFQVGPEALSAYRAMSEWDSDLAYYYSGIEFTLPEPIYVADDLTVDLWQGTKTFTGADAIAIDALFVQLVIEGTIEGYEGGANGVFTETFDLNKDEQYDVQYTVDLNKQELTFDVLDTNSAGNTFTVTAPDEWVQYITSQAQGKNDLTYIYKSITLNLVETVKFKDSKTIDLYDGAKTYKGAEADTVHEVIHGLSENGVIYSTDFTVNGYAYEEWLDLDMDGTTDIHTIFDLSDYSQPVLTIEKVDTCKTANSFTLTGPDSWIEYWTQQPADYVKYLYKSLTFNMVKKATPAVTLSKTAVTYNGKAQKPGVTVKVGGKKLDASQYDVKYSANKNVGKASAKVTLKGNYEGTKTVTFKINPKGTSLKSLTAGSKSITVKWNKQATKMSTSYITGYQIQIATNSAFTKGVKNYTATKYSTVSKKLTKLTGKKKYYVRIRTYKTVSGTKYYSPWSKSKYVTTKK